jgi:hypothetical protein
MTLLKVHRQSRIGLKSRLWHASCKEELQSAVSLSMRTVIELATAHWKNASVRAWESEMAGQFGTVEVEVEWHEEVSAINATRREASLRWPENNPRRHVPTGSLAGRTHDRMIEMEPGTVESWLMAMKIVANGLLWTSVLLATGLLLTWLVCLVHWRAGSF